MPAPDTGESDHKAATPTTNRAPESIKGKGGAVGDVEQGAVIHDIGGSDRKAALSTHEFPPLMGSVVREPCASDVFAFILNDGPWSFADLARKAATEDDEARQAAAEAAIKAAKTGTAAAVGQRPQRDNPAALAKPVVTKVKEVQRSSAKRKKKPTTTTDDEWTWCCRKCTFAGNDIRQGNCKMCEEIPAEPEDDGSWSDWGGVYDDQDEPVDMARDVVGHEAQEEWGDETDAAAQRRVPSDNANAKSPKSRTDTKKAVEIPTDGDVRHRVRRGERGQEKRRRHQRRHALQQRHRNRCHPRSRWARRRRGYKKFANLTSREDDKTVLASKAKAITRFVDKHAPTCVSKCVEKTVNFLVLQTQELAEKGREAAEQKHKDEKPAKKRCIGIRCMPFLVCFFLLIFALRAQTGVTTPTQTTTTAPIWREEAGPLKGPFVGLLLSVF